MWKGNTEYMFMGESRDHNISTHALTHSLTRNTRSLLVSEYVLRKQLCRAGEVHNNNNNNNKNNIDNNIDNHIGNINNARDLYGFSTNEIKDIKDFRIIFCGLFPLLLIYPHLLLYYPWMLSHIIH